LAIHVRHRMAMAAFPRVIAFHVGPHALGHFRALGLELLSRVHRVRDVMAPKVVERAHLGHVERNWRMRDVAIGTNGAHPGAILVVNRVAVLHRRVVGHFMAIGGAKRFRAGVDHRRPEQAQSDESQGKARQQNHDGFSARSPPAHFCKNSTRHCHSFEKRAPARSFAYAWGTSCDRDRTVGWGRTPCRQSRRPPHGGASPPSKKRENYCARIHCTTFLISPASFVLSALCSSFLPSISIMGLVVMCLVSLSSASALPLYFLAVSLKDGPSFFLSTAWHLRQSLFFKSAWAASASGAALARDADISPQATAKVKSNFIFLSPKKNKTATLTPPATGTPRIAAGWSARPTQSGRERLTSLPRSARISRP